MSAPPLDPSARRGRRRGLLILALVAVAGGGVGAALDRAIAVRRPPSFDRPPAGMIGAPGFRPPPDLRRRLSEGLTRDLALSEAQRTAVDSILDQQFAAMDAVTAQVRPALDSIVRAAQAEVDAVLTPEQRERVRAMRVQPPRGARPPGAP